MGKADVQEQLSVVVWILAPSIVRPRERPKYVSEPATNLTVVVIASSFWFKHHSP